MAVADSKKLQYFPEIISSMSTVVTINSRLFNVKQKCIAILAYVSNSSLRADGQTQLHD